MATLSIDPFVRLEGHAKIEVEVNGSGITTDARMRGMMFRGFERILEGRDPRDAIIICGRI